MFLGIAAGSRVVVGQQFQLPNTIYLPVCHLPHHLQLKGESILIGQFSVEFNARERSSLAAGPLLGIGKRIDLNFAELACQWLNLNAQDVNEGQAEIDLPFGRECELLGVNRQQCVRASIVPQLAMHLEYLAFSLRSLQ